MNGERRALTIGGLLLLVLGAFVGWRIDVATDITHFLPEGSDHDEVHLARELAAGELSRTMVLLIDAPSAQVAVAASRAFERELLADEDTNRGIDRITGGSGEGIEDAMWQMYSPHRAAFFAPTVDEARARATNEGLATAASTLREDLQGPKSDFLIGIVPTDPLLILPQLFARFLGERAGSLKLVDGRFLTQAEDGAVLFLTASVPTSNATALRPVLRGMHAAFARVQAQFDEELALRESGTHLFALAAEQSIKSDIQRVSIGSITGLTALFLVMFRSLRLVLLVLPIITAGFLAGTTACLLWFGSIHGLTLAFGAALIGVSVDYGVHFHCHHLHAGHADDPRRSLRTIWPGLSLGALTTITGFLALIASSFPGLRQLAVFAVVGIATAALTTHLFLPGLASRVPNPRGASTWFAARLRGVWFRERPNRALLLLPIVLVLAVIAIGLPQLRWNDGFSDLNRVDPEIEARDRAVRDRVVSFEQRRLVVATGATEEQALQANDRIHQALLTAQENGTLSGFRSLAPMLPSAATQAAVDAVLRADDSHWPRLQAALTAAEFVPDAFTPWRDFLTAPPPAPLSFAQLAAGPLGSMVQPFRFTYAQQNGEQGVGFVSFLQQLHDEDALRRAFADIDGASLIDIVGTLDAAFGSYRERLLQLWMIGLGVVLLLVLVRHRKLRPTLMAYVPAILGAAGTAATLSLMGLELNMLSLVALLMVVSMGVDYGVFLAEHHADARQRDATLLAVVLASLSTMLGFGLLASSSQPPLFHIGITSAVGVLLCLLLAPTVCALLTPTARSNDHD